MTFIGVYGLDEEEIKPKEEELDLKFLDEIQIKFLFKHCNNVSEAK